jgi:hypothetical protein
MQAHGPKCLDGPVRGSAGWWQELGKLVQPGKPPKKSRRRKPASIRLELVERVRREIADGTYDTQEKWEAALDKLLEHLAD